LYLLCVRIRRQRDGKFVSEEAFFQFVMRSAAALAAVPGSPFKAG
jgi:hypothetical protein